MKFRIFSWNVNGIRAISKKNVFQWLETTKPEFLFLQEIKATEKQIPKILKNEYKYTIVNSGNLKNQSGVLSYSDLSFNSINFCEEIDKDEGRIIEMKYEDIHIFNIYVPNGKTSKERLDYKINFYRKLLDYCNILIKNGNSIILCGDFNTAHKDIDLKKNRIHNKSGFTEIERDYLNKFFNLGFLDSYRLIHGDKEAYSWWSYRSNGREKKEGWRIDYILVSSDLKDKVSDAFLFDNILGSDHCPIGIEINI